MKRVLKRILPILLVMIVICSICWYLLVYDRDFTKDVLLREARYFDSKGNYSIATWLYNQAYRLADDNEQVAIELAEQFKAKGNFTQAERTLSNAIADGGSAELYIALCKTYVEQDKLLDAVTMLNNITDPVIKAQLDTQRPSVPTASHEPGFYSEYISLVLSTDQGRIYMTTDGEYPSTKDGPSDGNLTLIGGDNTIYALVLGDNGLVSPLGIYGYTVGGVIEEVTLTDKTIDALVRQKLNVSSGETLYSDQLWTITELSVEGANSYADLKWLPYLEKLTISDNISSNMDALAGLYYLKTLHIRDSNLFSNDIATIANLQNLEDLTIVNCGISDIRPLEDAEKLRRLDLSNNSIGDLSPLSFLEHLEYLDLSHNSVTSLNDIGTLANLKTLDVSYNALSSVSPLAACTLLEKLYIHNNTISDLSCADSWQRLSELDASFNSITDVSALSGCTALQVLDLSNNQLVDITALAPLKKLQRLSFAWNQVAVIPDWGKDCALISIDGSNNLIANISVLSGYENLNEVLMDYNKIESVNALAQCHNLVRVSVYGNPVHDVSVLKEMGVIVYYTPKT